MHMHVHDAGMHLRCTSKFRNIYGYANLPPRKVPAVWYLYMYVHLVHINAWYVRIQSVSSVISASSMVPLRRQ